MRCHADRAHSGPAAAVRNAEGLVQIQVAHVEADVARPHQTHHGIHVGAIHIDLTAVCVDQRADVAHALFEHAVRGRVGHHQRGQTVGMLRDLRPEVGHVDVAQRIAGNDHHFHAGQHGACRVRAVRGRGDQAYVAVIFAARPVVFADHQQAGVFTLRSGIRLE